MALSEYQTYKSNEYEVCDDCGKQIKSGEECYVSLDNIICSNCFYKYETQQENAYDEWRENQLE